MKEDQLINYINKLKNPEGLWTPDELQLRLMKQAWSDGWDASESWHQKLTARGGVYYQGVLMIPHPPEQRRERHKARTKHSGEKYHECIEWDLMWICKDCREFEYCKCFREDK